LIEADVIWTGDAQKPVVQALAIRGDEVIAAGNAADLEKYVGPETRRVKLPAGAMVTPGLIDAHAHLSMLGSNLDELDLREFKSEAAVVEAVKKWADKRPGNSWIIGRNWDQSLWSGQVFPGKASLDKVLPNRPVWLVRVDGHAGWANSEAMRRAKLTKAAKVPTDGQMIMGPNGEPTGLLIDGAMGLVSRAIPAVDDRTMRQRLLFAQAECLKSGLTGVHDAGLDAQERRVLEQMDRAGDLVLRVYGMASAPADPSAFFRQNRPGVPVGGSGRYELRAMKFFMDGAMGSRGALMFDDYSDQQGHRGLQLIDQPVLEKSAKTALETGWQVCTHAIGDRGNAMVLEAYEKAIAAVPKAQWLNAEPRFRVEHAQVVRRSDVKRFATANIIASMQPSHVSSDQRWADLRLGDERAKGAYALRWFMEDGVKLAFGSDFPVEVATPLWGLYGGLTRMAADGTPAGGWRPEHKLTMDELLTGFTAGSAYAQFAENRLGKLKPGYQADFVVFERDLRKTPGNEIMKTKVLSTWVAGREVAGGGK
jgi:predicted amidohydrolase YtcJ